MIVTDLTVTIDSEIASAMRQLANEQLVQRLLCGHDTVPCTKRSIVTINCIATIAAVIVLWMHPIASTSMEHSKIVLFCAVLCCAVLCCAVLCCAVLGWAVLCCAVLCCAVLCCSVLCSAVLGWAGLGWAGLGWAGLGWAGLRLPYHELLQQHHSSTPTQPKVELQQKSCTF